MNRRDKVFCVGLHKTGLTSLISFMKDIGFDGRGRSSIMNKCLKRRDFESILSFYDTADFFCDVPTPQMLGLIYRKYGRGAKYILTTRRSPEEWVQSLKRHQIYAHPIRNKNHWLYGRFYPHGFEKEHMDYYTRHNAAVRAFFAERNAADRLLELRLSEEGSVPRLLDFLEVESAVTEFPRRNVSGTRAETASDQFKRRYNAIVQPLYASLAPKLRPRAPRQLFFWNVSGDPEPGQSPVWREMETAEIA